MKTTYGLESAPARSPPARARLPQTGGGPMPLLRTSDNDLERIQLTDPDEWVEVKRRLGKDDERERLRLINNARVLDAGGKPGGVGETGTLVELATFATMQVAVKRWNVRDPETNRVALLTARNLRALSDDDVAPHPGPLRRDVRRAAHG